MFMRSNHFERRRSSARAGDHVSVRWNARRGFTIVELIAALILLGILFTLSITVLTVVARERRSAEQRQFAVQHAANLLERTVMRAWSELSPGPQTLEPASAELSLLLPDLERRVEVTQLKPDYDSKLVAVTLRWKN